MEMETKVENLFQNFAPTVLCCTFIPRLTQKVFIVQKIVPLLLLDIFRQFRNNSKQKIQ